MHHRVDRHGDRQDYCVILVGPDLEVQGDLLAHEYRIGDGRQKAAKVSKKWFRIKDTYGVQIEPNQDDAIILAVTVAIDAMVHSGK